MLKAFVALLGTGLATLGSCAQPAQDDSAGWVRVIPPGLGAFEETWESGTWPLGVQPVPGPEGELWMIGARQAWRSADGHTWRSTGPVPWRPRYGAAAVTFAGRMWSLGGQIGAGHTNEVWSSPDGDAWEGQSAPWAPRRNARAIVFRDQLWILGGAGSTRLADVWRTSDGRTWTRVLAAAPWSARVVSGAVVHRDSLWVIGGGPWDAVTSDVWVSGDGETWFEAQPDAPWGPRVYPGVVAFDGFLWVIAGVRPDGPRLNDVWSSYNGRTWTLIDDPAPWSRRAGERAVVFRDALWLFGGKGDEEDGRSGYASDVWRLDRRHHGDARD